MSFLNGPSSAATGKELVSDVLVANSPEDTVLELQFSPTADILAAALWDKKVRLYQIDVGSGGNQGLALYEHDGPVLSCAWLADGARVCSGGVDKLVKLFDVALQQAQQIGAHDAPVRSVRSVQCGPTNTEVVVLGLWDKTLKYWDMRQPQPISTLTLPERVYLMDAAQKLLVVGCAERHLAVINLENPQAIFKTSMLPLKFQTSVVRCYPTGEGFAVALIEGRCAIQYISEQEQLQRGFSFRCHRKSNSTVRTLGQETQVYAVNDMLFHPVYGTFATAGLDGQFTFWDKDAKQRLKSFPSVEAPVTATAFNRTGQIFAYARGYDWAQGHQGSRPDQVTDVKLHATNDEETKPKKKK